MPVSTYHQQWNENIYAWNLIRDCLAGEDRIKFKSEQYLPIPAAMLDDPAAPSTQRIVQNPFTTSWSHEQMGQLFNPNHHQIAAYAAYKSRARFSNLVSFLYRGLMGLASADAPAIQLPPELKYLEDERATRDGFTLSRLFVKTLGEVLLTGRAAHILEPVDDQILIVPYVAEQFINWKGIGALPTLAVFLEQRDSSDDDPFEHTYDNVYFALHLINGQYTVSVFNQSDEQIDQIIPTFRGSTLQSIPLTVFGSLNNDLTVDPAPLSPVANTSIAMYGKDADLAQSEYLSCNPTLVITGVPEEVRTVYTGPSVAFKISNPQAKVYYTTTDTSALAFIHDHINSLYEQAIVYGAQLLNTSKTKNESAETTRLHQVAAGATLRSVVTTVGNGFEQTLKHIAQWMNLSQDKIDSIQFKPLTEFGSALTPDEQRQLVDSWISGAISHQTVLLNFRKAGILGEGRTEEDELKALEKEEPVNEQINPNSTFEQNQNIPKTSRVTQPGDDFNSTSRERASV